MDPIWWGMISYSMYGIVLYVVVLYVCTSHEADIWIPCGKIYKVCMQRAENPGYGPTCYCTHGEYGVARYVYIKLVDSTWYGILECTVWYTLYMLCLHKAITWRYGSHVVW